MATLATETWTGTNGAAWPAQWTAVGGTSSIQANRGRLTTPATAAGSYGTAVRHLSGMTDATDTDVTVTVYPTTSAFQYAFVRICGSGAGGAAWNPSSGYQLWLVPSGGFVNAEVHKYVGGAESILDVARTTSVPWTTGGCRVRFQRQGATVRYKVWDPASSEPTVWLSAVTDATPVGAGKVALLATSNNDGVSTTVDWDDLTVTDGADVPTNLDKLRLGAGTALLRVGASAASKAYLGATQVWP